MLTISALEIDEHNEAEMAAHHVTAREAVQVLDDPGLVVRRNRGNRAASHILVGRTWGGRALVIPVRRSAAPGVWRPATAYDADEHDLPKHRR